MMLITRQHLGWCRWQACHLSNSWCKSMTEKKKPVTEDDPKQSEAFRKAVRDLEAAGELKDLGVGKMLQIVLN